eukprot:TRINITY_DN4006_c0_g1_i1.p1 TRINITY_DN4006_c0_g1~~TRINITY_DN4006_c0_g1_i1.p1  ORF type:complete len:433 (-),score=64.76 TRINITY_DN4006_c0_g1_i1:77-1315(-)
MTTFHLIAAVSSIVTVFASLSSECAAGTCDGSSKALLQSKKKLSHTKTDETVAAGATKVYELVVSGLCTHYVTSPEDCEEAAQQLWFDDTSVSDDGQSGKPWDPPGCYYEGGSLKFNSDGSNTGKCHHYDKCLCINVTATAAAEASKVYELVVSGLCTHYVTSQADCEEAAQQLWFDDTSVSDDGQSGKPWDPPGCYYESSSLKFNSDGSNTGKCHHYDKCLCINVTATAAANATANATTTTTTATPIPRACKSMDSPAPGYQVYDSQGHTCSWYAANWQQCGHHNNLPHFQAESLCCECSGGSTHWCSDTDYGALDQSGANCSAYYVTDFSKRAERCAGSLDDGDFLVKSMCCACGGGTFEAQCANTNDYNDRAGYGCDYYRANPQKCGDWDDQHFHAASMCCACGGGTMV